MAKKWKIGNKIGNTKVLAKLSKFLLASATIIHYTERHVQLAKFYENFVDKRPQSTSILSAVN